MTYASRMPACAHVALGGDLQVAREQVFHVLSELCRVYPKLSPQLRVAKQALDGVDKLRNVLDDVSAAELPGEGWAPTIYYGANRDARERDLERVMAVHWADNPDCPCTRAG